MVKKVVLRDGAVSDDEARWVRKVLLEEGTITPREVRLLEEINRENRNAGGEFATLYREVVAGRKT